MEGRLSLTIEPGIVQRAKRVARERNTSLSAMVEDVLREAIAGREEGKRGRGEEGKRGRGEEGRISRQLGKARVGSCRGRGWWGCKPLPIRSRGHATVAAEASGEMALVVEADLHRDVRDVLIRRG